MATKSQNCALYSQSLHSGGGQKQSIVQILEYLDAEVVEYYWHRRHDPGKYLRGEAETEGLE